MKKIFEKTALYLMKNIMNDIKKFVDLDIKILKYDIF